MNRDIRTWSEHAKATGRGKQPGRGTWTASGSNPTAGSLRPSYARHWMKWPAVFFVLMVLMPVGVQAQSALDGFNPGANGNVEAFAVQADGKTLVAGEFTTLGGGGTGTITRNRIGRLNADGSLDMSFNPGANGAVYALALQADGKILVAGSFTTLGGGGTGTTPRHSIGRLNADGSLDTSFNPGANSFVSALAVQADGKILVGGYFSRLGGVGTGTITRHYIGRLNADGTLDASFNPGANTYVFELAVQGDGRILVGGIFTTLGGGGTGTITRNHIGRLNVDGSLDTSFNPGADDAVWALAVQADSRILVGGWFTTLGGGNTGTATRNYIGRLNADGTLDTSFDPGANNAVWTLAVQADGRILVGGDFATLGGGGTGSITRNKIGRLNADGSLDTSFDPGANNSVLALAVQADGKILVGGAFTTLGGGDIGTITRNRIGRLYADGSLDSSFDPGANSSVFALAVQPDGKILVGGYYTRLGGGGTGTITRCYIGRLNPNGSLDTSFDPGGNNAVFAIAMQADGKILVGGDFTTLGGGGIGITARSRIGRLNADGSLDASFDPGANSTIYALAVQADGKILVAGSFTTLGGGGTGSFTRNRIGRLNADGSLDTSFDPGADGGIYALAVQADGKILVGGVFTSLGGGGTGLTTRNRIGRLNADGSLDTSFDPGANGAVSVLAVQADGKILVGGYFTSLGGGGTGAIPHNNIGRLNADGSLDTSFDPGANGPVRVLAMQADGKTLVGGAFTTLGGGGTGTISRYFIGRLHADGSLDTSFDPGASSSVVAIAVQADGKILVGGWFSTLGGGDTGTTTRNGIGRLTNTDAALQNLTVDSNGTVITWERKDTAPEIDRVTFELSINDPAYTTLGNATRIADGWTLTGLSLPKAQNLFIRARGFYSSGLGNGSESIVESVRNIFITRLDKRDFNGDGKADIVWRHTASGDINVWFMNGATVTGDAWLPRVPDQQWQIVGIGDFDGDGSADVLWRYTPTGDINLWFMNGSTVITDAWLPRVSDSQWQIAGIGDFNKDGKSDIVWRHTASGEINVWFMDGGIVTSDTWLPRVADLQWQIAGIGDFNGDRGGDIVWKYLPSGDLNIWRMNGTTVTSDVWLPRVADPQWQINAVGDFNGDGNAEIVWRHTVYGDLNIWFLNGVSVISDGWLPRVADLQWKIFGPR
jgi:uncharacterized delta-60 repeat protein